MNLTLKHLEELSLAKSENDVRQIVNYYQPQVEQLVQDEAIRHKIQSFKPFLTKEYAEALYNLGEFLVEDDKFDLGYYAYKNRPHYYHGKLERDHPSTYHHWPLGILFMVSGGILGTIVNLMEMKDSILEADGDADSGIK